MSINSTNHVKIFLKRQRVLRIVLSVISVSIKSLRKIFLELQRNN